MKKDGLRLGNLISVENLHVATEKGPDVFYRRVEELNINSGCICVEDGYNVPESICSGIQLTQEILECTGIYDDFLKAKDNYYVGMRLIFETRRNWYRVYLINSKGQKTKLNKNIRFLHELQNLTYNLTGDELYINMDKLNNLNK